METVWLQRPGADTPWGFRLHGGRDYQTPLTVQKVTPGSIAATGLSQDDVIVRVGDTEMSSLTYTQAMDVIKNSGNLLQLSISKGGQGVYSPQVEASNMASDALHDLFHDMYRHSDGYSQEGAHSQSTAQPSYPYQPSYSTGPGAGGAPEPTARYDPYGGQQYGQPDSYCAGNIGAGASPAPPSQAPPSYREPQQPAAHPATRLEQQLSNMGLDDYGRPLNSFGYAAGSPQQSPGQPPSAPAPPGPYYGGAPKTPTSPPTPKQHAMPDAVLNMAARGEPDKKPFTYAPDMESIKEQRDKVRRSLKKDGGKDITQSPVYRMIHGLDESKPKPRAVNAQPQHAPEGHKGPRTPQNDELCFTGVLDRDQIPSKSFHRLQNMTAGSDNVDTSSIRHNISGNEEPDEGIGAYDQASIRYTGKNIPSKSFRMLQTMTGDTGDTGDYLAPPQQRRPRRHRPDAQSASEQNPDDIVDISYVGGNIPSRSFKVLQNAVGSSDNDEPSSDPSHGGATIQTQNQGRTVKVIKLRHQNRDTHTEPSGVTDF